MTSASTTQVAPGGDAPALASRPRIDYLDLLRVLGAIAVVTVHMAAFGMETRSPSTLDHRVCAIVHASLRWCVPIFILISGALLLPPRAGPESSAGDFYRKRLPRIGVPLLFWTAFFALWTQKAPGDVAKQLILGRPHYHLYFLFILLGLYLVAPMLRVFVGHATRGGLLTASLVWLGAGTLSTFIEHQRFGTSYTAADRFMPWIGYFLLGAYLRDAPVSRRALAGYVAVLIVCLAAVLVPLERPAPHGAKPAVAASAPATTDTEAPANRLHGINRYRWDYLGLPAIGMSIALFMIAKGAYRGNGAFGAAVRWVAPATLGIYLLHPAIRDLAKMAGIHALWPNVWLGVPLSVTLVFLVSLAVTLAMQRVPVLRRVVG